MGKFSIPFTLCAAAPSSFWSQRHHDPPSQPATPCRGSTGGDRSRRSRRAESAAARRHCQEPAGLRPGDGRVGGDRVHARAAVPCVRGGGVCDPDGFHGPDTDGPPQGPRLRVVRPRLPRRLQRGRRRPVAEPADGGRAAGTRTRHAQGQRRQRRDGDRGAGDAAAPHRTARERPRSDRPVAVSAGRQDGASGEVPQLRLWHAAGAGCRRPDAVRPAVSVFQRRPDPRRQVRLRLRRAQAVGRGRVQVSGGGEDELHQAAHRPAGRDGLDRRWRHLDQSRRRRGRDCPQAARHHACDAAVRARQSPRVGRSAEGRVAALLERLVAARSGAHCHMDEH